MFKAGDRVRLTQPVERYPHFMVAPGQLGTIISTDPDLFRVRFDNEIEGCADWENEVHWVDGEDASAVLVSAEGLVENEHGVIYLDGVVIGYVRDGRLCEHETCIADTAAGLIWHSTPGGFGVTLPKYHFATREEAIEALRKAARPSYSELMAAKSALVRAEQLATRQENARRRKEGN